MTPLTDAFGRHHDYLRLSITDRCNLRCRYCMPPEGVTAVSRGEVLSYEELLRVVRVAVSMGVRKVRVTGGEPLVRRDAVAFLEELVEVEGLRCVALSTNGLRLPGAAARLAEAGVSPVNVSLDTLDPDRYRRVTRGGEVERAVAGVDAALEAGLRVKLNAVLLPGLTDASALQLVRFAADRGVEVRFIEFMPLCGEAWSPERFRPASEIQELLASRWELVPVDAGGVAEVYELAGSRARVGLIASVTRPFCGDCSRLRVSSTGRLYPCLFSAEGIPLRPALRGPGGREALREGFRRAVARKGAGNPSYTGEWSPGGRPLPVVPASIRRVGG